MKVTDKWKYQGNSQKIRIIDDYSTGQTYFLKPFSYGPFWQILLKTHSRDYIEISITETEFNTVE
jgi:hypothetical protein